MEKEENKNIVIINGKEYDINSSNIAKDYITGKYIDLRGEWVHTIITGIDTISYSDRNDRNINMARFRLIKSHFDSENAEKSIDIMRSLNTIFLTAFHVGNIKLIVNNEDLEKFEKLDVVRGINNPDIYYFKTEVDYLDRPKPYRRFNNIFSKVHVEDVYSKKIAIKDKNNYEFQKLKSSVLKRNIEMGVDSLSHNELEGIKYTLGYEIETVSGSISEKEALNLNVAAVHDGSLRGPDRESPLGGEYVTGILYGDAGFKQLYNICKVLNKNCTLDHRAGVHIHIGSLNWNNEDIVYSYILAEMIEDEMYSMLPKSRKTNEYCRKIKPLLLSKIDKLINSNNNRMEYKVIVDQMYNSIFRYVSGGYDPGPDLNSNYNHPKGDKCGYDKSSQRYCWLNYVTLLFNTRNSKDSYTLEIRSHSATMNYIKIRNWAKIWVAFCNFVDNNKKDIRNGYITKGSQRLPINLETIVSTIYPKSGSRLVKYIKERKEIFKSKDESIDYPASVHNNKSIKEIINIE